MPLKTPTKSNACSRGRSAFWLVLLCAVLAPALTPAPAHAYAFTTPVTIDPATGVVCPNATGVGGETSGLTRRIMPCIKENILNATNNFLMPFSIYMADTVSAACILAVAIWGLLVMSGKREAPREIMLLGVKISCVVLFSFNFGGFFPAMLDSMDEILGIVGSYVINISTLLNNTYCPTLVESTAVLQVWDGIDCAVETLLGGVYSQFTLANGIAGFLFGALFSNTMGFFIALLGFYLVVQFLFIIARALYIFIAAYIGFALMVIISPIFIPMILFTATKGYFEKWLRLTGSFMLQPIILFAYLSMLVAAYDAVVFTTPYSIAYTVAGADAALPGFNLGGWVNGIGGYAEEGHGGQAVNIDPKRVMDTLGLPQDTDTGALGIAGEHVGATALDWQYNIFDYLGVGDMGLSDLRYLQIDVPTEAVHWDLLAAANGQNTTDYMVSVMISFTLAAITAYIMLCLLEMLPFISASLLGEGPGLGLQHLKPPGSNMMSGLQDKMSKAFTGGGKKGQSSFR